MAFGASERADANPSGPAVLGLLSLQILVPFLMQLSLPGLSLEPAHMFPGAAFSVSNLSLGPASLCAPLAVSLCAVRLASLRPA